MVSLRRLTALGLLFAGLSALGMADEPKKPAAEPRKAESKGEKYTSAASIDFAAAYDLSFDSLTGLGARIEQARKAGDPVGLAAARTEMKTAEKVSGKKADLTAEALEKEAVELAKLRGRSAELKALSVMLKDEEVAKELEDLAAKAKESEADEAKAFKSGEHKRGATTLRVVNYTDEGVDVYVDGQFIGHANSYDEASFFINKKHKAVKMLARHSRQTWGPTFVEGDWDTFTWELK
jgi:hypothetical protein